MLAAALVPQLDKAVPRPIYLDGVLQVVTTASDELIEDMAGPPGCARLQYREREIGSA
jgi:hypothetical protein